VNLWNARPERRYDESSVRAAAESQLCRTRPIMHLIVKLGQLSRLRGSNTLRGLTFAVVGGPRRRVELRLGAEDGRSFGRNVYLNRLLVASHALGHLKFLSRRRRRQIGLTASAYSVRKLGRAVLVCPLWSADALGFGEDGLAAHD